LAKIRDKTREKPMFIGVSCARGGGLNGIVWIKINGSLRRDEVFHIVGAGLAPRRRRTRVSFLVAKC
jgi:hypothetical protein